MVSDKGSNYVLAGKLLKAKGPICIGLHVLHITLEDIGKIPRIAKTLEMAIQLIGYTYNHGVC